MVLDGHAINIWKGEKIRLKGLSTPTGKERTAMIQDYHTAAEQLGVPVQAVQAVTWYIWKYTGKTAPIEASKGVYDVSKFRTAQPANDISLDEVNAIGSGGIVGAGMGNAGSNSSKKLLWSGNKPLKENASAGRVLFHVTPWSNWKFIKKQGLIPQVGERGIYADNTSEPRTYLFEDLGTLEDAMVNWFVDKYEDVRWFAILRVHVPENIELFDDPEIAGSFYTTEPISPLNIVLIRKEDGGLDENVLKETFYHGTSTVVGLKPGMHLLPPNQTEKISEKGRHKNLDKVFFTKDVGSAKIYAGRAVQQFGGNPTIFKVEPEGQVELLNPTPGSTVYMSSSAKISQIILEESENESYMTLFDLYGKYNTPEENELLWEYVGMIDYNSLPFKIVHVNPMELANTKRNIQFLNPKNMNREDRLTVRAFEKIANELSKRTIIVVEDNNIVDGFHRVAALSNKGITSVRALDLSQPKTEGQ
jgi:hypothetical protein